MLFGWASRLRDMLFGWVSRLHDMLFGWGMVVGVCDRGECDVHEGCGCCGIRVGGRGVEVVGMVVGVS